MADIGGGVAELVDVDHPADAFTGLDGSHVEQHWVIDPPTQFFNRHASGDHPSGGGHYIPAVECMARRALGPVNVYRRAFASWYGGGGPLACGGTLTDSTLGVASKTLPCGTMVRIRLGRRTVRVPVIDRGPYVAGREFDLTSATKRALGFGDLGVIWVTS